ncbi:MAG: hypothetical protein ABIP69_03425 [Ferruginibacter sp.]
MNRKSDNHLLRYAGLASQFLIGIGIMVFGGLKADEYFKFKVPLLVWILPLLLIISVIIKLIKETSSKK